jgi:Anti-sigma-K factor rskA
VVSSELRELSPGALPDIPAEGAAELDEAFEALEARKAARDEHERSSKLGGILLLVGLGIAVAVALVLVLNGGDDKKATGPVGGGTTTTQAATTTNTATTPQVEAQVNLFPPSGAKKPLGVANVVTQQGQRGIALVGQDMPATGGKFAYAMWLTSASAAKRLGFFPAVKANGRMQGFVLAPADFASYTKLVVTRETQKDPKVPGRVVLSGNLPKK